MPRIDSERLFPGWRRESSHEGSVRPPCFLACLSPTLEHTTCLALSTGECGRYRETRRFNLSAADRSTVDRPAEDASWIRQSTSYQAINAARLLV